MDLSQVPDLELRRKVKPINDRIDAINVEINSMRSACYEKLEAMEAPLQAEAERLGEELEKLIGEEREITGTCDLTGLPIFDDDETVEKYVLAAVADSIKAAT